MHGREMTPRLWVTEEITENELYSHGVVRVIAQRRSAFQEMLIVESCDFGRALILDGVWQTSVLDEFMYHEPLVLPPLMAHGDPKRVLVMGGGDGGSLREVLKWPGVERAVLVDIDPEVVALCREHLTEIHQGAFDDPRAEVLITDALEYVAQTGERFDVIISDLTDPLEDGPAFKLFTAEHLENCRKLLTERGFFSMQAGSCSPVKVHIHARVVNTVKAVFPHATHYLSHTPTYGVPLGFALAGKEPLDSLLARSPEELDALLASRTSGGWKYLDGQALQGLLRPPKYVRDLVEAETTVYTLAAPPSIHIRGILGDSE